MYEGLSGRKSSVLNIRASSGSLPKREQPEDAEGFWSSLRDID